MNYLLYIYYMFGRLYNKISGRKPVTATSNKIVHVADGAFGCVYKADQDPCADTTSPLKPGEVSKSVFKLMRKREAEKEINESSTIPPSADGVVIYKGRTCVPSTDFKKKIKADSNLDCTARKYVNSDGTDQLIIYQNGGPDVFELLSQNSDVINSEFLLKLSILAGDIDRMNKKGAHHLDVKTENMVYDVETKEARLIDPGLMINSKNKPDPWSSVIVQSFFPYDALIIRNNIPKGPDYYLHILQGKPLKDIKISNDYDKNRDFFEIIERRMKGGSLDVYRNLQRTIGTDEYIKLLDMRGEQYDVMMESFYTSSDIKARVLETIDIYALGFVFIEVLCSLYGKSNFTMKEAYMKCIRIIFATIHSSNVYDRNVDQCLQNIQTIMKPLIPTFVLPSVSMASDIQDISPQSNSQIKQTDIDINTGNALGGHSIRRKRRKTTKKRKYRRKRTNKLSSKV
jgi:serine/threonine protein kinase